MGKKKQKQKQLIKPQELFAYDLGVLCGIIYVTGVIKKAWKPI